MTDRRIALVTGANRGIGLEVARQLIELDHDVVLGSRDVSRGDAAVARLDLPRDRAVVVQLDVECRDQGHFDTAVRECVDRFGGLDVLINNAGVDYDVARQAASADVAEVETTFAVNLFGAWRLAVAAAPHLRRSSAGRLVNVSSSAGALSDMENGTPAYSASKAALNVLTIKLAAELESDRILCNAVCPGWVATDMGGGGRPVPEGAKSVVWAATLSADGPTGGFFRDGLPIPW